MYDRAPRDLVKTIGSTPAVVGPGSYEQIVGKPKTRADGYAPFLSLTSRETFLNISDQTVAAPGPGHYDPKVNADILRGGMAMASKAKRFSEVSTDTPGPGSYNVAKDNELKQLMASQARTVAGKGLLTSRIKFHRKPEAPSIPTPGQAYGYEENDDGTLRKQASPQKDNSLGPAYYSPKVNDTKSGKKYKGVHFGQMTSKRSEFGGKGGPGPGEYDLSYTEQQQALIENANVHEEDKSRFEARIPRYHEVIVKEVEKKGVPGPGKYDVKGQFDIAPPKVNTEGLEVEHPPFMSQAKRFHSAKGIIPAPGSYNDPRNAFESTQRISGLKRSPFGQTSIRFERQHHIRKTPGPGSYNITGLGSESMRRAYIESTRRGVFGTTASRAVQLADQDQTELPGPAHYQCKEKPFQSRYQQLSSMFASVTPKVAETPPTVQDIPPPGSYEVHKSYEKSQAKIEKAKPRNDEASRKQGSFMSSATRFAPPRDTLVAIPDMENPGPGTYEVLKRKPMPGGLMTTRDKRFAIIKSDIPGPGAYEYSPLVQDTVLKGTFNATLNNPLMPHIDPMKTNSTTKHAFLLGV